MPRHKSHGDESRAVTLQDIADRCGVSRITASCALRGDRKSVSQAVMDKIVKVAREMGYDPALAHAARRLKYQHSPGQVENHLVALFFPLFKEHYWSLIFEGINRVFHEARYGVVLSVAEGREPDFREWLPYVFRRGEVDGALIFAHQDCRVLANSLIDEPGFGSRPIVTMAEQLPGHAAVVVDDRQAGYLAAAHLLELGHRHLLCFHHPEFQNVILRQRVAGHEQAMRERGLDPGVHLHHAPWVWDDPRGLEPAMEDVLCAFPGVTGIIFPNDNFGIQAVRAVVRLGRRIPEELSVMGVDDSDIWAPAEDRNIWTTVRLPLKELGETSARLLLKRIQGGASDATVETLPATLVTRGSTCPLRVAG